MEPARFAPLAQRLGSYGRSATMEREMTGSLLDLLSRAHEMLALGAGERLQKWQREHARLDHRISRKHLASYLGVTPEHLSRLKRAGKTAIRTR